MDKRRELYLIFKEAINNLVKYSKAKNVKIELWSEGHRIIMSVTDDGIGFDSNTQQYGNGITNMRQRAANCGAQLQISSQPGKGTSVHLEIQTV
jgi:signal transduction histidine kinase